jgi:hypothetical protein
MDWTVVSHFSLDGAQTIIQEARMDNMPGNHVSFTATSYLFWRLQASFVDS